MKGLASIYDHKIQYFYTLLLAGLCFEGYYLVMRLLPGNTHEVPACVVGGALTTGNVVFSAVLSLMTAVMIMGLVALYKRRARSAWTGGSALSVGFVLGFLSVFCAVCTLPVISVFGLAVGLGVFTAYNAVFKMVSLSVMAFGLWLIDAQLKECGCS